MEVGELVGVTVGVLVAAAHSVSQHGRLEQVAVPHSGPESHATPGSPPLYAPQFVGKHWLNAFAAGTSTLSKRTTCTPARSVRIMKETRRTARIEGVRFENFEVAARHTCSDCAIMRKKQVLATCLSQRRLVDLPKPHIETPAHIKCAQNVCVLSFTYIQTKEFCSELFKGDL